MEAEQVVKKILADANTEAEKIKAQAKERQAAEQAELDKDLSDFKKQTDAIAENAAQNKKLHLLATARMDIAKDQLAEKRKILDQIFEKARQNLQNLPDDQYCQLMAKLMLKAVNTGDEEVIIDHKEKRIDQNFIKQINRDLGPGYKGNLRLSDEKQAIGAGFILKRGRIKNNVSIDIMLTQARQELEIELAKELFKNTDK